MTCRLGLARLTHVLALSKRVLVSLEVDDDKLAQVSSRSLMFGHALSRMSQLVFEFRFYNSCCQIRKRIFCERRMLPFQMIINPDFEDS